jgi:acetoin utilization deacetylase AcuC-like enzyme
VIKREHIKQAIDAIAARAPDIGRALDDLFGMGRIDVPPGTGEAAGDTDFHFRFDTEKVRVKKFLFINEGTAPIERGLLIKYGELLRKRELTGSQARRDFLGAAREVRRAGLKLMVAHEIDLALARAPEARDPAATAAALNALNTDTPAPPPETWFRATLEAGRQARFIRFPFTRDALEQVAGINLEFFHVRFLLNCLLRGLDGRLFACTTDGRIAGMLLLDPKPALFTTALEIKYIATLRGRGGDDSAPPPRGVGRFLVAGVWLLWKTGYGRAQEIVLESEIGARRFYEHVGFQPRGPSRYVLSRPTPRLLRTILEMAENSPELPTQATLALSDGVVRHIRSMGRLTRRKDAHEQVAALARTALACRTHPAIATAATRALLRARRSIAEVEDLIELAGRNPDVRKAFGTATPAAAVGVACDARFTRHLENVFHLESPKRYEAIQSVIEDPAFAGRLQIIAPRPATPAELAWAHTPAHIGRVAETAGRELAAFDLDTQTTAHSFETACLAAGAVFGLLETIWSGRLTRGFAAVRPPGHHAEAGRAMGFCLFNNTALGARYLQERHGVARIMVVDIDAHHGNGTQSIFYDSAKVLCVSIHQFPGFPGTGRLGEVGGGEGEGYTVNIPLHRGHGDLDFLCILQFLVRPLARAYRPEILLVPCGFDLWLHDRLADMRVTAEGYGQMTALLAEIAAEVCGGRIAFVMEGGYSAEGIRQCGFKVLEALCRPVPAHQEALHRVTAENPARLPALKKAIALQRKYWRID